MVIFGFCLLGDGSLWFLDDFGVEFIFFKVFMESDVEIEYVVKGLLRIKWLVIFFWYRSYWFVVMYLCEREVVFKIF